jgi:hypothetical protein
LADRLQSTSNFLDQIRHFCYLTPVMPIAPLTPVAYLRAMIHQIVFAMTTLCGAGKMTWLMSGLILGRLNRIKDCLARITERVEAGRYAPRRRSGRPRPQAVRRPRPPGPLPRERGWLAALLPAAAPGLRGDLEALLFRPDMVALIGAAPTPLIPPLRSLCWALKLRPPPILARPRRPAPEPAAPPPATPAEPPKRRARPSPPAHPDPSAPPPPACGAPAPRPPNPA